MLACGEDLGMIPSCVHPVSGVLNSLLYLSLYTKNSHLCNNYVQSLQVMEELGLIGLRIQRMPNEPDLEFGIPSQYGYMTVSCL